MGLEVRKAKIEEIGKVQDVAKISWNSTYEGIIPLEVQEQFLKSAYNDEMMKRRLKGSLFLIAKVDGEIVGFANFSPVGENGRAELAAIYLYPEYQGQGIGSALLREGIENLNGLKEIYINVEKDNEIGTRFYEAKGFKTVKEFDDDFNGHILKTVRMALKVL